MKRKSNKQQEKKSHKKPLAPNLARRSRKEGKKKKVKEYTSKLIFPDNSTVSDHKLKRLFLYTAILIAFITVGLAINSGINGDDSFQNAYADKIVDFYTTMGKDTAAFYHPKGPIQYYGGAYELPASVINRTLGLESIDAGYHYVRHIINAMFGMIAMIFIGLMAKEISGWRAGILALVLIFLSPRFLGHSLMNPKDIPFAAGVSMSLYFIMCLMKKMPKPDIRTLAGLSIGIGVSFGTRAGGLLVIAYLGLFLTLAILMKYGLRGILPNLKLLLKYAAYVIASIIIGLAIGILVWPYAIVDPFNHIPESLNALTKYAISIKMLFNGEMIHGNKVPPYYLPVWILKTVPFYVHIGLVLCLVFIVQLFKKYSPIFILLLIFTALFPIVYVIIKESTLYDGWRHLIFFYPSLVVLVAVAWNYIWERYHMKKKIIAYIIAGTLGLTMLEPAVFIIRNYAYPYIYFNMAGGGLATAYGNFETDYWGVSVKQGIEWLEKEGILHDNMKDTITIVSNFSYQLDIYVKSKKYKDNVNTSYVRFRQRYDKKWDYGLFLSRFVRGTHIKNGTWPPKDKTIHTITANGIPLLGILKNDNYNAANGVKLMKEKDFANAINFMEVETKQNPSNEIAWTTLANSYLSTNQLNKAKEAVEKALDIEPQNLQAFNILALYYYKTNDTEKAIQTFKSSLEFEPKNSIAYYYIAVILANKNELQEALTSAKKTVETNPKFKNGYLLVAQIYQKLGNEDMANKYKAAANKL